METIMVVGYPRSGTVWLTRLLSCALDSPIVSFVNPPSEYQRKILELEPIAHSLWDTSSYDFCETGKGGYCITKTHWMASQWDGKGKAVFIQRDPRDVAVSAAHYLNVPLWDILKNMCVWSETPFDKERHIFHVQGAYQNFVDGWLLSDAALAEYEYLVNDCTNGLRYILSALGEGVLLQEARAVCEKMQFPHWQAKYPHSMRKGIVGDWKNHFDRKHGEMITKYLGTLMLQQGYIEDLNWWQSL